MKAISAMVVILGVFVAMAGCESAPSAPSTPDVISTEGIWTFDDTLYRRYSISREEAYLNVRAFFKRMEWTTVEADSSLTHARVEGTTLEGTPVKMLVRVPRNSPTEIGIKIGDGDHAMSSMLLNDLELGMKARRLPDMPPKVEATDGAK